MGVVVAMSQTPDSDDEYAQLRAENERLKAEIERLKAWQTPEAFGKRLRGEIERRLGLHSLPTREEFDAQLDEEIRKLLEGGDNEP